MRSFLAGVLGLCVLPSLALAQTGTDNPFKKARVGDWVEYKMSGPNFQGTTKMIITAKDDKEATFEMKGTFSVMGKEFPTPAQKVTIDLTKPYDPISAGNVPGKDTKVEKLGEGKEKIKAAGKEYSTEWTKMKTTATLKGVMIVSEVKTWMSKDVPLGGLVRMETTTPMATITMELTGSGKK